MLQPVVLWDFSPKHTDSVCGMALPYLTAPLIAIDDWIKLAFAAFGVEQFQISHFACQ